MRAVLPCLVAAMSAIAACPPAQEPEVVVQGRVLDASWRPIRGALVRYQAGPELDATQPSTQSDAEGRFELVLQRSMLQVEFPDSPVLVVEAEGRASAVGDLGRALMAYGVVANGGRGRFPDLVLPPGRVLAGRVRGPAEGDVATVRVVDLLDETVKSSARSLWTLMARAECDRQGIFRVRGVPLGPVWVSVGAAGFVREGALVATGEEPLDFDLRRSELLRGSVRAPDGSPVACDLVVGYANWQYQAARSGSDGEFAIALEHRGPFYVSAIRGERELATGDSGLVVDQRLDLVADEDPGKLMVQVVDADGRRAEEPAAIVYWRDAGVPPFHRPGLIPHVVTWGAEAGVVELPGPVPGDRDVGAMIVGAKGFAWQTVQAHWEPGEGETSQEIEVTLSPEALVRGRVVWRGTDELVPDARVWATVTMGGQGVFMDVDHPYGIEDPVSEDGSFVLRGLAAGTYDLFAFRPGSPMARLPGVPVGEEGIDEVILEMPGGCAVHGKVSDEMPVGWSFLASDERIGSEHVWWRRDVTRFGVDAEGAFAVTVPRTEECTLMLVVPMPPNYGQPVLSALQLQNSEEPTATWQVGLAGGAPGTIRGRVRCPIGGFPLQRLAVLSYPEEGSEGFKPHYYHHEGRVGVESDGSFELLLGPGDHVLEVVDLWTDVRLWRTATQVTVPAGGQVDLVADLEVGAVDLVMEPVGGNAQPVAVFVVPKATEDDFGLFASPPRLPARAGEVQVLVPEGSGEVRLVFATDDGPSVDPVGWYDVALGETQKVEVGLPGARGDRSK